MTVETPEDLVGLVACGRVVAEARDAVLAAVEPGVSTGELDDIAAEVLARHGAVSAPQYAYDFPGVCCISVNEEAAHGIPSRERILRDGDIVNVDVSAVLDGYWTDTGASTVVGEASPEVTKLLDATRTAQANAMAAATAGATLRDVASAVERTAKASGHRIIANLCGHGVGRWIHEEPSVSSVARYAERVTLTPGMVLAIEPFLSPSGTEAVGGDDGWTLYTDDGSIAAQFEHTIVVTNGAPLVLTASIDPAA